MMRWSFFQGFRGITKNPIFWLLLAITGIAIFIRILPSLFHAAWGCDFGIYYGITNTVVESAEFFPSYYGWGGSYNEFPVMYAIVAFAHWITGIDIIVLMPKLIPIFGGLTVFIFYFIVKELTENKKIAILSSLLLAVSAFHVYQLSHSAPLVIGHFFMMLSFYFFIKYRQNYRYIIPLVITTMLLIMSHHFTTFIYIVSLISIVFFENLYAKEWSSHIKKDIYCILITSVLAFSYWAIVAKTVFNGFMRVGLISGIKLHPIITISLFYVGLFGSFVLIKYLRKLNLIREFKRPTVKSSLYKFSLTFFICLSLMITFTTIDLPGHKITFSIISVIYSIPLLIIFSFAVAGFRQTRIIKNGLFLRGWLLGLLVSFMFSIATGSTAILPERHPEYISIPVSAIAVLGIGVIFSDPEFKLLFFKLLDKRKIITKYFSKEVVISQKKRLFATGLVICLVVANGLAVYPSFFALGPDESISAEDINAIEWMFENLDINETVIASDHRLERFAEGSQYNFSTTGKISDDDKALKIWASEDLDEYFDEINGTYHNYSRVTHVLIDSNMKYNRVHVGEHYEPQFMTNETWDSGYEKFNKSEDPDSLYEPIYSMVYRNDSAIFDEKRGEPISWAEVYEVNWTYLDEY